MYIEFYNWRKKQYLAIHWLKTFQKEKKIDTKLFLFFSLFQNVDVEVVAIVNDAVGTLMSTAHTDRNCEIGLILGTGCNACYMENLEHVGLWDEEISNPKQVS